MKGVAFHPTYIERAVPSYPYTGKPRCHFGGTNSADVTFFKFKTCKNEKTNIVDQRLPSKTKVTTLRQEKQQDLEKCDQMWVTFDPLGW